MSEKSHEVKLHIYDLSQGLARQISTSFLGKAIDGIWHTGVVVYSNEYYFGGGIQHGPAGETPYGKPIDVVDLGVTYVSRDVFEVYLQEISPRYTSDTYSLLKHNCNNFSNEVSQFLVGVSIPDYILQLPNEVLSSPMGPLILPLIQNLEMTLQMGAVPQAPQFKPLSQTAGANTTAPSLDPSGDSKNDSKKQEMPENTTAQEVVMSGAAVHQSTKPKSVEKGMEHVAAGDPLAGARDKIQEEISREFTAIMGTGSLRASEAAARATKKVLQKYGKMNVP